MNLSINNMPVGNYNQSIKSFKGNKHVSEINTRNSESGSNINNLVYASMILASLGLGACKDNNGTDKVEAKVYEYQDTKKDSFLPPDYAEDIEEFMSDDNIVGVTAKDTVDANYDEDFRVIYAKGYDRKGKLVKSMEIHPFEPARVDSEQLYCPEPEFKNTTYFSDRKETKEYDNGEYYRTEIVYNKPVTVDGVSGYRKTKVLNSDGGYVDIFTKGNYKITKDALISTDGDYHEKQIIFDRDDNRIGLINYRSDENGKVILDEENSDLPSDF